MEKMEGWRDGRMEEWDRRLAGLHAPIIRTFHPSVFSVSTHPLFQHSILAFHPFRPPRSKIKSQAQLNIARRVVGIGSPNTAKVGVRNVRDRITQHGNIERIEDF
jgi:hypothetical protein